MNIYLGYTTAYDYWRESAAVHPCDCKQGEFIEPVNSMTELRSLLECTPFNAEDVEIISKVGDSNQQLRKRLHTLKCFYPVGSFVRVAPSVFLSCPELSFLQMASVLSFNELILYGCELCAGFVRSSFSETGLVERTALTNLKLLKKYVSRMTGVKGARAAQRSLAFINENAASPREIALALLLSLPYRYGGYGLPAPKLNERIEIAADDALFASKSFYRADLLWADQKLVVEYDSNLHASPGSIANDACRRNALLAMGYTVITVTNDQIKSTIETYKVAKLIARLLKKRIDVSRATNFKEKHAQLRRVVLEKN